MAEDSRTPREQIANAASSWATPEQIKSLIDEVLAIKKQTWANCPHCKKRSMVEIPDAKAVAGALKDLLAEGFGRPKDERVDEERIVFTRKVIYEGEKPE